LSMVAGLLLRLKFDPKEGIQHEQVGPIEITLFTSTQR